MAQPTKRGPLKQGRRIPLTITIDANTLDALIQIGRGNRSAAIETVVRHYLSKPPRAKPESVATPG